MTLSDNNVIKIKRDALNVRIDLQQIRSASKFSDPEALQSRIYELFERYNVLVERETPELSLNEWLYILATTSGSMRNIDLALFLHHSIADAAEEHDPSEEFIILSQKVAHMTLGARISIIEILDRLAHQDADRLRVDLRVGLIEVGARIID